MGNGPAGVGVWIFGSMAAIVIAYILSSARDENGALGDLNKRKFIILTLVQLPIVFVLGVVAIFAFM